MGRLTKYKAALIEEIESLYPIDSEFKDVNAVGEQLLIETLKEMDWRNLSEEILGLWREKCIQRDLRYSNDSEKA